MSDPSIRHRFSAAAATYDQVAEVQSRVAEQLARLLPALEGAPRILEIGCGTGLLTAHVLEHYPRATIDALDIAAPMIEQAKRRCNSERISWHCADYTQFDTDTTYDLICSSSTLHWLRPLDQTFIRMQKQLSPDGQLAISLMLHDTFCELHALRNTLFPHKPVEQRLPSLVELAEMLPDDYELEIDQLETEISDARSFFHSLNQLGVTGGAVSRAPLSPAELKQLMDEFTATSVTWQIGYIFR